MSLLPEDAHFEELVQDCFLAFHGAGVMLSPLDAELLSEWAGQRVPFEVVARGIRKAAERALWDARPNEPALRTLRACRREVGAEIRKYLDRAIGGTAADGDRVTPLPEALELTRHKKLRAALKKFAKARPAQEQAVSRLLKGALASPPADLAQVAWREDWVIAALARALPWTERRAVAGAVRGRMRDNTSQSPRSRRFARRLYRAAEVRERLELPPFW